MFGFVNTAGDATMLDSETHFDPDPPSLTGVPPLRLPQAATPAPAAAAGVTPRRPLRFTSARVAEDAPAQRLPLPDLFAGVFEDDTAGPAADPRIRRSRARARALMDAHEADLDPALRNLWHDYETAPDSPGPAPAPSADPAPEPAAPGGRRPIRHLTAADLAAPRAARNRRLHTTHEDVADPLRDHLRDIRTALYAPVEADTPPAPRPALTERLTAGVLNLALVVAAMPVGLALTAVSLLRGPDLRLSARTVATVGALGTVVQALPGFPL